MNLVRMSIVGVVAATLLCTLDGCHPSATGGTAQPSSPTAGVPPVFEDVAAQSGLDYTWVVTGKRPLNILQTIGDGVGFLDYDRDGNLDILLVGPKVALFRGDGKGHFADVSHQVGLDTLHGDFRGCAVGDYDNDGYPDIYLSAVKGGVLLHNDHGKRFVDVTAASGIKPQPWGSSCAFVDVDNDGKLDLIVGNYVKFDPVKDAGLCPNGTFMTACGPNSFASLHPALYRNLGGGRFQDITHAWGVDKSSGTNLGVAVADFDGSGHQSIAFANDEMPGDLLKNTGRGFVDIGGSSGTGFDANGNKHAGMGIDWGDYDDDGLLDLVVTTYQNEPKCVYHNDGADLFTEESSRLGVGDITKSQLSFGVKWIDFDNSGYLGLLIANGHVEDNVNQIDPKTFYRQPMQLLRNEQGQRFTDASGLLSPSARTPIVGRGLAIGDFDNDGREDAVVADSEGHPLLLHNICKNPGHWLEVDLTGVKSNRDGLGAILTAQAGGLKLTRLCTTTGSYLSASDKRVHFGLGAAATVDTLTVKWPSGHVDTYRNIAADRQIGITEGHASIEAGSDRH